MVNKVILIGRVGQDPQSKKLDNGTSISNFTLATSEKYKNKSGEKVETTEWHSLQVWGNLSEIVEKYVKKGQLLYVEGKIKTKSWEKEGQKHYKTVISVNEIKMLGSNSTTTQEPEKPQSKYPEQQWQGNGSDPADDLPF